MRFLIVILLFYFKIGCVHLYTQPKQQYDLKNFDEDIRIPAHETMLLGHAVATGDVNGDGFKDIIAGGYGAKHRNNPDIWQPGRAYIIFGGSNLPPLINIQTPGPGKTIIYGSGHYDMTGHGVACGDVNGDGLDDVVIGAPQLWQDIAKGIIFIVYGREKWPQEIDLGNSDFVTRVNGKDPKDVFGWQVATGNINSDSYADIVVNSFLGRSRPDDDIYDSKFHIIYGSPQLPDVTETVIDSIQTTVIQSFHEDTEILDCLDLNQDGFTDILITDLYPDSSSVYIIYGRDNLPGEIDLDADYPSSVLNKTRLIGELNKETKYRFGYRFTTGDINSDGFVEFFIGTEHREYTSYHGLGKVYVIFGNGSFLPPRLHIDDYADKLIINGVDRRGQFGAGLTSLDFDADGIMDVAISSPSAFINNIRSGKVTVFYGHAGFPRKTELTSVSNLFQRTEILGYSDYQALGNALAAADINGDSIDDLIIAAEDTKTRGDADLAGEIYVIYGKKPGQPPEPVEKELMLQSYPNPFNSYTVITYRLSLAQPVTIKIYNIAGQEVKTLVNGLKSVGEHSAIWDGMDKNHQLVSSGIYICRIQSQSLNESIKMLYLQ